MGRTDPLVLAIDLGTSGPKIALIDACGRIIAKGSRGVETIHLSGGGVEQRPSEIWRTVMDAAAQVLGESKIARDQVLAVAITSQFSSIIPVDKSGSPLMNMILWMDRRGGRYVEKMCQTHREAPETWIALHGRRPSSAGGHSLGHILYVQSERRDIYDATHAFLEPMDYLAMRLTGEFTASRCTAFATQFTDNRDVAIPFYHPQLIKMAAIDLQKLPRLVGINSLIGTLRREVASELGLGAATRVFSGTNDTQAASIATGVFAPGRGGINIGSTSQILAQAPGKRSDPDCGLIAMPSPIDGQWLVLAENGLAGKSLDHYLRNFVFAHDSLGDHSTYRPFERLDSALRATPPGSNGLLFLPWLTGAESPVANDRVRGAFINITLSTSRETMLRAVLEGVAFSLRWLRDEVEMFVGQALRHLHLSGGGARLDGWAQILADVMGRPICQLESAEYAGCRSAAFLALGELELVALTDAGDFFPIKKRFVPRAEYREIYDRHYEHFLLGVRSSVPVFEALNA